MEVVSPFSDKMFTVLFLMSMRDETIEGTVVKHVLWHYNVQ